MLLQPAVCVDPVAVAADHEHTRRSVGLPQLHAAEQHIVRAVLYLVEPVYRIARQYLLGRAECSDRIALDAQQIVGYLGRQIYLMQRHDDRDTLLMRHITKYIQQLYLVSDIQIGRRLVQHDDVRLLRYRACQHDPLALTVGERHEVMLCQILRVYSGKRSIYDLGITHRELPDGVGIGVSPHRHDLPAGHQLGLYTVGQHHCHGSSHLLEIPCPDIMPPDIYISAYPLELARDGL